MSLDELRLGQEQSFSLLVLSDGRVWRLQGRLFGPVRAEEN